MSEEEHIKILPLEKKPSYTIQDAYLGKYFISSTSNNDNMLGKKRNEHIIKKEAVLHNK